MGGIVGIWSKFIDCDRVSPAHLSANGHWLIVLDQHLRCAWPEEGCALLLGPAAAAAELQLAWIWPCLNRWCPDPTDPDQEGSRRNRFSVDPGELVAAQRWGRQRGWQLLGSAHSHPSGGVQPSPIDLSWGWDGCLMLIRGLEPPAWGAWWLHEDAGVLQPRKLIWPEALGE
ncbi:MAG: hypothetical protein CBB79_07470 [Synechococcus sp. TMED19]|nr:MAG: hypothetical protein CBB79_07470 [Synechococcus sp. TMED19]